MLKLGFVVSFMVVGLFVVFPFIHAQEPTGEPPRLTFSDLQQKDFATERFRIKGYVIQTYKCPPCPEGSQCKPCLGDHIVVTDTPEEKDLALIKRLRIFNTKPEQFELKKQYSFLVKIKGKKRPAGAIEQVDLISFETIKK